MFDVLLTVGVRVRVKIDLDDTYVASEGIPLVRGSLHILRDPLIS